MSELGNYTHHVQWHPETATYTCIGCGAQSKFAERKFVDEHKNCDRLLTAEQIRNLTFPGPRRGE